MNTIVRKDRVEPHYRVASRPLPRAHRIGSDGGQSCRVAARSVAFLKMNSYCSSISRFVDYNYCCFLFSITNFDFWMAGNYFLSSSSIAGPIFLQVPYSRLRASPLFGSLNLSVSQLTIVAAPREQTLCFWSQLVLLRSRCLRCSTYS